MKKKLKLIPINKTLLEKGINNLPIITIDLNLMDLIAIYNLCKECVYDYPEMIGYKNICEGLKPVIKAYNKV